MRALLISLTLTAALTVAVVSAEDARSAVDPSALKDRVAALVRDLSDNSRGIRSDVRRKLVELGPAVLPLLPAPEELPNASVREAVREVRLSLEKTRARESVKASRVELPRDATLEAVLTDISKQTGNEIDASAIPAQVMSKPLRFDAAGLTFWNAVELAASQAGLTFAGDSKSRRLKLEPRGEEHGPSPLIDDDGVFRIAVPPARLRPIFGDEAHRLLRVELQILTEPRLRPLFLQYAARDIIAVGEREQTLDAFNPQASYELPLENGRSGVVARADFRVSATMELKEFSLRGSLKMQTAAGSETFEFRDLEKSQGVARRRGGVVTTLQKVRFEQDANGVSAANIGIGVAYETGGPAFESHRTWIFHNEAYLETADGKRIDPESDYKTLLQADGAVAVEYRFEGIAGQAVDYRFVYVAPTLIINVPVNIDLRKVPVAVPKQ